MPAERKGLATYDLGPYTPVAEDELHAAARAVHEQRAYDERGRAAEALNPFERALVAAAFDAGAGAALSRVHRLSGPAAVTLDAAAVRAVGAPAIDVRPSPLRQQGPMAFGPSRELVEIVARARERASLYVEVPDAG